MKRTVFCGGRLRAFCPVVSARREEIMEEIKMKRAIALTLVLLMVLALCACGSNKEAVGTWELTEFTSDGEDLGSQIKAMGFTVTLVMNEDGTGYMDMLGEKLEFTWKGNRITTSDGTSPFKVEGDTLTIDEGTDIMVFARK